MLLGLLSDRSGFTLVEALVSVGLLAIVTGLVVTGTFQILSIQSTWRDDALATKELRHAGSWFAGDALNTASTSLADLATSSTIKLEWTNVSSTTYVATYSVTGTSPDLQLIRELSDGAVTTQLELARRVASWEFSRSGRTITLDLEVYAAGSETASSTLTTFLRNMN